MKPDLGAFGVQRHPTGFVCQAIRTITQSPVNHAGIYVGVGHDGREYWVEAQPGGAVKSVLPSGIIWSKRKRTPEVQRAIAEAALGFVGTPYSYVDVCAIGLAKIFGLYVPGFVRDRLNDDGNMMCSQLADRSSEDGGDDLFDDGRLHGDVSPGDLLWLIIAEGQE